MNKRDKLVKALFKKIKRVFCPQCESREVGYHIPSKKWNCNICGWTWH